MNRTLYISIRAVLVVTLIMGAYLLFAPMVNATHQATPTFHTKALLLGWAWSPTIGWISVSCDNTGQGPCTGAGSNNYKVQIRTDKNLEGYAWSSNIGWIKFGGLSGAKPANGVFDGQPRVRSTIDNSGNSNVDKGWELQGWARACAATVGGDCSGALDPNGGGWDGWIALSGQAITGDSYSVKIRDSASLGQGTFNRGTSAAWGSTVVGWIDFTDVFIDVTTTPNPPICTKAQAPNKCDGSDLIKYDLFCGKKTIDCSAATAQSGLLLSGGTCDTTSAPKCVELAIVADFTGTFSVVPAWARENNSVYFTWDLLNGNSTVICRVKANDGQWYSGPHGVSESDIESSIDITRNLTTFRLQCDVGAGSGFEDLTPGNINTGAGEEYPVDVKLIPDVHES